MAKTQGETATVNIRVYRKTYDFLRKRAYKNKSKIIRVLDEMCI